ncbi:hypothetical protein [Pseudomonas phage PSA11]|nr:hypothetical protein [Pseudomonas phage PSA11]
MINRFESKFDKVDSGCWEWNASRHGRGYGLFYTGLPHKKGKMDYAHRVSMHLYRNMDMSDDREVCHTCDNTFCVNPDHLFLGSHSDNMKDMVSKGRHIAPTRKLSQEDYELAGFMRSEGVMVKEIAAFFKIDTGHASRVSRIMQCSMT